MPLSPETIPILSWFPVMLGAAYSGTHSGALPQLAVFSVQASGLELLSNFASLVSFQSRIMR